MWYAMMNSGQSSFDPRMAQRGLEGKGQTASLQRTDVHRVSGISLRSMMLAWMSCGDMSERGSGTKRYWRSSSECVHAIPRKNASILSWITFHPTNDERLCVGHGRTRSPWSGRPRMHPGSTGSNVSSQNSRNSPSRTPTTNPTRRPL